MKTWRRIACGIALCLAAPAWALPKAGALAPPLHFDALLQAPPNVRVDGSSLRGKAVVLEFWATWCAACIASIPRLNELQASVDPGRVIFISVDDEDPKVVQAFLKRRKISGWIGLDEKGATLRRFGVEARPATIVIDGAGRIAAITSPEQLNAKVLMEFASRSVKKGAVLQGAAASSVPTPATDRKSFPTRVPVETSDSADTLNPDASRRVFELSIARSNPGQAGSMVHDSSGNVAYRGLDIPTLLRIAYGVPFGRFTHEQPLPQDRYDLVLWLDGIAEHAAAPLLKAAVCHALRMDIRERDIVEEAYVLSAGPSARNLLQPTAAPHTPSFAFVSGDTLHIVNSSLDDIAIALESHLDKPVLNESGIEGRYDAEVQLQGKTPNAALSSLGLHVTKEQRAVPAYVMTPDYRDGGMR
ncbi:MAG TPA: redoxin domain-containing protein [Acidobacteriaceae bacterium]|nr:redoxin domain-containing protein [Acidobacteriaceae bacterium]